MPGYRHACCLSPCEDDGPYIEDPVNGDGTGALVSGLIRSDTYDPGYGGHIYGGPPGKIMCRADFYPYPGMAGVPSMDAYYYGPSVPRGEPNFKKWWPGELLVPKRMLVRYPASIQKGIGWTQAGAVDRGGGILNSTLEPNTAYLRHGQDAVVLEIMRQEIVPPFLQTYALPNHPMSGSSTTCSRMGFLYGPGNWWISDASPVGIGGVVGSIIGGLIGNRWGFGSFVTNPPLLWNGQNIKDRMFSRWTNNAAWGSGTPFSAKGLTGTWLTAALVLGACRYQCIYGVPVRCPGTCGLPAAPGNPGDPTFFPMLILDFGVYVTSYHGNDTPIDVLPSDWQVTIGLRIQLVFRFTDAPWYETDVEGFTASFLYSRFIPFATISKAEINTAWGQLLDGEAISSPKFWPGRMIPAGPGSNVYTMPTYGASFSGTYYPIDDYIGPFNRHDPLEFAAAAVVNGRWGWGPSFAGWGFDSPPINEFRIPHWEIDGVGVYTASSTNVGHYGMAQMGPERIVAINPGFSPPRYSPDNVAEAGVFDAGFWRCTPKPAADRFHLPMGVSPYYCCDAYRPEGPCGTG